MARIPDHVRAAALTDLRNGTPVRETARRHNIGRTTASTIAAQHGVDVAGRPATKKAREANLADYGAVRGRVKLQLARDAERMQAQLWAPAMLHKIGGKDNVYTRVELERPDFAGQREIMIAVGIAVDKMAVLDRGEREAAESAQTGQAGGLLSRLVDGLVERRAERASAEATPEPGPAA